MYQLEDWAAKALMNEADDLEKSIWENAGYFVPDVFAKGLAPYKSPNAIPTKSPVAVPGMVPVAGNQTPTAYAVPYQEPYPTPIAVPGMIPTPQGNKTPYEAPIPTPVPQPMLVPQMKEQIPEPLAMEAKGKGKAIRDEFPDEDKKAK